MSICLYVYYMSEFLHNCFTDMGRRVPLFSLLRSAIAVSSQPHGFVSMCKKGPIYKYAVKFSYLELM